MTPPSDNLLLWVAKKKWQINPWHHLHFTMVLVYNIKVKFILRKTSCCKGIKSLLQDFFFSVTLVIYSKGQIISKGLLFSSNSPKKRTNEFVFTTTTNSFVRFLGEFEDTKKSFRNYLTFKKVTKIVNFCGLGLPRKHEL